MFESEAGGSATSLVQAVHIRGLCRGKEPDRPRRLVLVGLVLPCLAFQAPPLAGGWLRGAHGAGSIRMHK